MVDLEQLGARIQAARTDFGLTLQQLADRSAVSVSMLSAMERGAKAPTIVVLARVAVGLDLPLTELLAEQEPPRMVIRRAAEQDVVHEAEGWSRAILSPVVPGVNFEWIRSTLPAGCAPHPFDAYAPGSHEYLVVHSGTLRVTAGTQEVVLDAGDSLYFAADVTHSYANPGEQPCVYYVAALIMRSRDRRAIPGAATIQARNNGAR
ncbi:XRE family transcriptional regulator [Tamaricihabitans halophyticus]|uniref:XRE family transcriptional regulator n=1 Tax=Tamaricihabitans halophyticus TaxID=1262583 RepID=A0A4R2QUH3_9PSEU|nr:cupin domain-containing protein [Tamaricihabitans halophyticus]TCP53642.1 XRE family transcriptional regulator [Tamaricihabitans halophyticus]